MEVMIGVDPHKGSHTATMLDRTERELPRIKVRAGRDQLAELLEWADGVSPRTWAVESAGGMGYLLAQQLVAAGETVLDVPATLASRVRVLGSGPVDQDRSERRPLGRSRRFACLRRSPWCAGLTMTRCAGCWPSTTPTWPVGEPSSAAGYMPWSSSWCPAGSTKK